MKGSAKYQLFVLIFLHSYHFFITTFSLDKAHAKFYVLVFNLYLTYRPLKFIFDKVLGNLLCNGYQSHLLVVTTNSEYLLFYALVIFFFFLRRFHRRTVHALPCMGLFLRYYNTLLFLLSATWKFICIISGTPVCSSSTKWSCDSKILDLFMIFIFILWLIIVLTCFISS